MIQILSMIAPLFAVIVIGYISGRLRRIPIEGLAWLNFFVVYVSLPAMFFLLLSKTPFEQFKNESFLLSTTLITALVFALSFIIARKVRHHGVGVSTIQGFAGSYGNFGYLGPPLAMAAFGPEAAVPVALIFCLDNTLHFTLAPLLMSVEKKQKQNRLAVLAQIAVNIIKHPFILATIAGILGAWYQYSAPAPVETVLTMLAAAAAPCALFAMGVTAAIKPLKRIPVDLLYLVPIKLIIHPLLMYLALRGLTGVPTVWFHTAVLLAALPSATNVFVLAQQYDTWSERALSAVVISTLFASVTVTLYLYWIKTGLL